MTMNKRSSCASVLFLLLSQGKTVQKWQRIFQLHRKQNDSKQEKRNIDYMHTGNRDDMLVTLDTQGAHCQDGKKERLFI